MGRYKLFLKREEQQICDEYFSEDKPSTFTLAKKWGCYASTIRDIIIRNGFILRTQKESLQSKETRKKLRELNKGKNNPMYGKHLSENSKRRMGNLHKIFTKEQELQICNEYFSEEKPGTPTLAKRWNCNCLTIRNIIRRNGYVLRTLKESAQSKETKRKINEKMLVYLQNHHGFYKNTKLELKMKEILNDLNIPFKHQFRLGNHLYDFYILNTNILIEADGNYWHSNPKIYSKLNKTQQKQRQRDIRNEALAKENGFVVLRFWESDILNNTEKVIKHIKGKINGKKKHNI